jgi:thioredoxin 1
MIQFYYFTATWCQPCRNFKPVVEQVAGELGITMQFIDVDQNTELVGKYAITTVPTILAVQNGQPVYRNKGIISKPQLISALKQFR